MIKSKFVIFPAMLVAVAALGASAANARDVDVQWSVTIGSPVYREPVPVYAPPVVVYREPVPVYAPPPVVYRAPVVVYRQPPAPVWVGRYRQPTRWDRDGDGIPNRYDRVYNPVWDRDGDGIPNRRDARYNPRWDRDGDGVPNRYDRHDGGRDDSYGYGGGRR